MSDMAVTLVAEGDEVGLIVVAGATSKLEMMDLQVFRGTAALALPTIALQHAVTE